MNVKYAILGFLSWRSFTGYEIKKMFSDSIFIHWSGSNNQIYQTLVGLHRDGLVTSEIHQQEKYPSRKVYTITEKGLDELRQWVASTPELPQYKNTFLIQLAWADQLSSNELDDLLAKYEYEIDMQVRMHQEQKRRNAISPARTKREALLWNAIADNRIALYECELTWVRSLRQELVEV